MIIGCGKIPYTIIIRFPKITEPKRSATYFLTFSHFRKRPFKKEKIAALIVAQLNIESNTA